MIITQRASSVLGLPNRTLLHYLQILGKAWATLVIFTEKLFPLSAAVLGGYSNNLLHLNIEKDSVNTGYKKFITEQDKLFIYLPWDCNRRQMAFYKDHRVHNQNNICWTVEHFLPLNQQDKNPKGPGIVGWRISVSRLCNALKNSSELRFPSLFVSNTWKIMSTTVSVKSTPQTYNADQNEKLDS